MLCARIRRLCVMAEREPPLPSWPGHRPRLDPGITRLSSLRPQHEMCRQDQEDGRIKSGHDGK
jgi:hypothetical protein